MLKTKKDSCHKQIVRQHLSSIRRLVMKISGLESPYSVWKHDGVGGIGPHKKLPFTVFGHLEIWLLCCTMLACLCHKKLGALVPHLP